MSRRLAITATILLLLVQAVPVFDCMAMPAQVHSACCCEPNGDCAMVNRPQHCAVPDSCCVQAAGSVPALCNAVARSESSVLAFKSTIIVQSIIDPLAALASRTHSVAAHLYHTRSAPPSAIALYLRHLHLML